MSPHIALLLVLTLFAGRLAPAPTLEMACPVGVVNRATEAAARVAGYYQRSMLDEQLAALAAYIAIPTVSGVESHRESVERGAELTARMLREAGVENVRIEESLDRTHVPVVYGATPYLPGRPTILLYGHFDVAPIPGDQLAQWLSDPFTMRRDGDWLYGRGVADDKGGVMSLITAVLAYRRLGLQLPVNIRFVIEGGEEVGASLAPYLAAHPERFQGVDAVILCDGVNRVAGRPVLEISARGAFVMKVSVTGSEPAARAGANRYVVRVASGREPLHSGVVAGGAVPNPLVELSRILDGVPGIVVGNIRANGGPSLAPSYAEAIVASDLDLASFARRVNRGRFGLQLRVSPAPASAPAVVPGPQGQLLRLLSSLYGDEQWVSVPGFYEGIEIPSYPMGYDPAVEIFHRSAALLPRTRVLGNGSPSPMFRVARLPSMNVGAVNVDGDGAHMMLVPRTVPGMDINRLVGLFRAHVEGFPLAAGYRANFLFDPARAASPFREDIASPLLRLAALAMTRAGRGVPPLAVEEGGTLPLLWELQNAIPGIRTLFHAVADLDSRTHGPNERMRLSRLIEATRMNIFLFEAIGQGAVPFP